MYVSHIMKGKRMKNKLMLVVFMLSQGFLIAENNHDPDFVNDTKLIMKFLSKSKTKWNGDTEWIKNLKKDRCVETNYSLTRYNPYKDKVAKETNACFKISKEDDDFVNVISHIEYSQIGKVSESEIAELKEKIECYREKSKNVDSDDYSTCDYECKIDLDEKTKIFRMTLISNCKTKIPFELFKKKMREMNRDENEN